MFPDPRLHRLSFEYPGSAGAGPWHSAYKLNKQGDNIQLWRTPFPIWNQSVVMYFIYSWKQADALRRVFTYTFFWNTTPKINIMLINSIHLVSHRYTWRKNLIRFNNAPREIQIYNPHLSRVRKFYEKYIPSNLFQKHVLYIFMNTYFPDVRSCPS